MKVEILFPEVGNLCGDLMNIRYLRQCCPELSTTGLVRVSMSVRVAARTVRLTGVAGLPTFLMMLHKRPSCVFCVDNDCAAT